MLSKLISSLNINIESSLNLIFKDPRDPTKEDALEKENHEEKE